MRASTDRKRKSSIGSITKIIPYNEYLQLKNAYITLKEKNKKLKEEKLKIESLLKEYQLHITDYKSSNNTIKILFQKVENNYKELNIQKNSFKNIFKMRVENFKISNTKKNSKLRAKKDSFQIYSSNEKEESFRKTLNSMRNNNDIITQEYNNTINRYIEVINQLNKEIKLKDELFSHRENETKKKEENKYNLITF